MHGSGLCAYQIVQHMSAVRLEVLRVLPNFKPSMLASSVAVIVQGLEDDCSEVRLRLMHLLQRFESEVLEPHLPEILHCLCSMWHRVMAMFYRIQELEDGRLWKY